jgi:lipopolysaccharide exporter
MSLKNQIVRGSVWITIARASTNSLAALSAIVLARLLVPEDFGLVALATSLLIIVQSFTELSLAQALIHNPDPTPSHYHTVWTLGLMRGLLLSCGFAVAAPIAAHLYGDPRLETIMFALAAGVLVVALQNPQLIKLQKEMSFRQDALLTIASSILGAVVSIVIAAIFHSYWALVIGTMTTQISYVALSYAIFPFRPALRLTHFREFWGFSAWASLGQIVSTLNYRLDQVMVGTFVGRYDLGLYTVGSRLAVLPGQELVRPLTSTLFPAFRLAAHDRERLVRVYQKTQAFATSVAMPASLGFGLIADPVVRLVLGNGWLDAIPVVQLIALVFSLDTLGSLSQPLAMAEGNTKSLFVRNCQKFAVRLPMMALGLYLDGLIGLLYARMISGAIGVVIDMTMVKRLIGLSLAAQVRVNLRCFAGCAAMSVVAMLCTRAFGFASAASHLELGIGLAVTIVLSALAYVLTNFLLWRIAGRPSGPEAEILEMLSGLAKRIRHKRSRQAAKEA